jgi:hypothetical protein
VPAARCAPYQSLRGSFANVVSASSRERESGRKVREERYVIASQHPTKPDGDGLAIALSTTKLFRDYAIYFA